ncbi:MAG: KGG domain-containing protein [Polyangiaceae bacterium]|nr:KGG domain-containing protein [Polyangiaceae bacterium]
MNSVFDPTTSSPPPLPKEATVVAEPAPRPRRPRGFAAMDRSKVSEIASKGGKAAHAAGTAHQFTSAEARDAGRKGGIAPHVRRGRGPRKTAPSSPTEPTETEES